MNEVQPIRNKKDIAAMRRALKDGRDRLLFVFGINSGLRISDLLELKKSDTKTGVVEIVEKKTKKKKRFVLNDSILKELQKMDIADDEYLFASRKGGKPISRVQAYRILNAAAKRCGLTEIGTHTLRKTFGYHAYKRGTDLTLLMSIFNHSSEAQTLKYIGIRRDDIDATYKALNL